MRFAPPDIHAKHRGIDLVANIEAFRTLFGTFTRKIRALDEGRQIAVGKFDLDAVFLNGDDFAGDLIALLVTGHLVGRVAAELLDAERDALLLAVDVEHHGLHRVALLVVLDRLVAGLLPVEVGEVDHAVDTAVEADAGRKRGLTDVAGLAAPADDLLDILEPERGLDRLVLAPEAPSLRLVSMSEESAHSLDAWARRIAGLAAYGYFALHTIAIIGADRSFLAALLRSFDDVVVVESGPCAAAPGNWPGAVYSFAGGAPRQLWQLPTVVCGKGIALSLLDVDGDGGLELLEPTYWTLQLLDGRTGDPFDQPITVTILNVDDPPQAVADSVTVPEDILTPLQTAIQAPNGIVLVTGPTGSGKTTTLYSAINELNSIEDKIITTEDPVEYDMDGIIQVPIDASIGNTFAHILRSILRQDPDKILVGEIRDLETAEIAVQASLTGHLVFSTLHTNDAPSTIVRMKDMGVPTFLITATVEAILAQRLVRKVCMQCREEYTPPRELLDDLDLTSDMLRGKRFYRGAGCELCNNTGYKGRVGLFELMIMSNELRDAIMANAQSDELREIACKQGMVSLREAGIKACFDGTSTPDEVVRETILEA